MVMIMIILQKIPHIKNYKQASKIITNNFNKNTILWQVHFLNFLHLALDDGANSYFWAIFTEILHNLQETMINPQV